MPKPKLPTLIDRKLYKTGQTRGADDDVIYQNRVLRNSTVLIPYSCWHLCDSITYENGFIVLLSPAEYFGNSSMVDELEKKGLALGKNALVFYESRDQWLEHDPKELSWQPATRRRAPLGGQYVARVPANTSSGGSRVLQGFTTTSMKGAGIRVYEYADKATIASCRLQLEALFWLCKDSADVVSANGMRDSDAVARREAAFKDASREGLLEFKKLSEARLVNDQGRTICPLCLAELSAVGFFDRMAQAEGRAVLDLTVTELNLFHISELRVGVLNHRPYNLGWGHHHCNVVVKDAGIAKTLTWMKEVLQRNNLI